MMSSSLSNRPSSPPGGGRRRHRAGSIGRTVALKAEYVVASEEYVYFDLYYTYAEEEAMSSKKKKLTLSVDERVIERARRYSNRHNTSISQLVTKYLSQLDAHSDATLAPWVQRLRGILPSGTSLEDYRRHLEEKHS